MHTTTPTNSPSNFFSKTARMVQKIDVSALPSGCGARECLFIAQALETKASMLVYRVHDSQTKKVSRAGEYNVPMRRITSPVGTLQTNFGLSERHVHPDVAKLKTKVYGVRPHGLQGDIECLKMAVVMLQKSRDIIAHMKSHYRDLPNLSVIQDAIQDGIKVLEKWIEIESR